ncbi:hypothetical protein SEA_XKCD426_60 [Streptomyces phage Xkcd426]|nr:hypothetical protein SEA_XKCD426_60 [Streptomyces phage Xkcd426]
MNAPDWTTPEYLSNLAAEELRDAMAILGIGFMGAHGDEDGCVTVAFHQLADAEALMTLGVQGDERPGSLYDRATASCVTLSSYAASGTEPTDEEIRDAIHVGWTWTIHPAMHGRRMGWHVSVDIPHADAATLAANLNALRLGGTQ